MASHAQPYPTNAASHISHGQKARSNQVWVAIGTYQLRSFRQGHNGQGHDHSYVQLLSAICLAMASHANPVCYTGLFWPAQTFCTLPPTKEERCNLETCTWPQAARQYNLTQTNMIGWKLIQVWLQLKCSVRGSWCILKTSSIAYCDQVHMWIARFIHTKNIPFLVSQLQMP